MLDRAKEYVCDCPLSFVMCDYFLLMLRIPVSVDCAHAHISLSIPKHVHTITDAQKRLLVRKFTPDYTFTRMRACLRLRVFLYMINSGFWRGLMLVCMPFFCRAYSGCNSEKCHICGAVQNVTLYALGALYNSHLKTLVTTKS